MNVLSLSALLANYAPSQDGNDASFMDALAAATWQQVNVAHKQACTTSSARTQHVSDLNAASGSLVGLQKTKDGTRYVLGNTLASSTALKSQVLALGNTLSTEESYNIAVLTKDANGNPVAGAKYVASAAERAAIATGTLVGTATADGVETRAVTSADGNTTTNYQVYTKEHMLTASIADVKAVVANMQVQLVADQKVLNADLVRLRALTGRVDDFGKQLADPLRKREKQAGENKQVDRQDDFKAAAELRRRRNDLIVAREKGTSQT